MIIKVDKEAQGLIKNLCDFILKVVGIANPFTFPILQSVLEVLNKMELLEEKPKEKPE